MPTARFQPGDLNAAGYNQGIKSCRNNPKFNPGNFLNAIFAVDSNLASKGKSVQIKQQ
jgi:hypothetical protein